MAENTADLGAEVLAHLRQLEAKGSPGLAAKVVGAFLRDTSARVETLRAALARNDAETVRRVAHTLQGSAAMVGAASLARNCGALSQTARRGSLDGCARVVTELEAAMAAIGRAVRI
jgi:HPt (histidine-containing phosphotransfer) domain-containing protein